MLFRSSVSMIVCIVVSHEPRREAEAVCSGPGAGGDFEGFLQPAVVVEVAAARFASGQECAGGVNVERGERVVALCNLVECLAHCVDAALVVVEGLQD